MIRGIHYFSTELKAKIDVIPRGCFNKKNDDKKYYLHAVLTKVESFCCVTMYHNIKISSMNHNHFDITTIIILVRIKYIY